MPTEPKTHPPNIEPAPKKPLSPWRANALRLVVGLAILVFVVLVGRGSSAEIEAAEDWITGLGIWGPLLFVGLVLVLPTLMIPDTVFAVAAGAAFGVGWGTAVMIVGGIANSALVFWLSRRLLRKRVQRMLQHSPKLAAVERAAAGQGLRFQFLLRLTPISPVGVSYVLGATGTRFSTFLIACLGIVPGYFTEVYFGYVAKHVTKLAAGAPSHSTLHTAITGAGLVVCILVMILICRMALKAVRDAEAQSSQATGHPGSI